MAFFDVVDRRRNGFALWQAESPSISQEDDMSRFVTVDPEIQSGAPVFTGTRVPVKNLFDYLEEGDSLDTFLDQFPTVTRERAVAVLEEARAGLSSFKK
jgi:uncharacterized protein (DUF433 family)